LKKDRLKTKTLMWVYLLAFFLIVVAMYGKPMRSLNDEVVFKRLTTLQDTSIKVSEVEYDILIDLTESALYLFRGDELIKKYPVAQGTPETPLRYVSVQGFFHTMATRLHPQYALWYYSPCKRHCLPTQNMLWRVQAG